MKQLAVLVVLCSSAALAVADDRVAITVRVGETVTTEVSFAMGHLCDDEKIVRGEMRNKDATTNVFAVTGLAAGTTLCRVGTVTVEGRPTYLFEITVTPAPAPVNKRGPPPRPAPRKAGNQSATGR